MLIGLVGNEDIPHAAYGPFPSSGPGGPARKWSRSARLGFLIRPTGYPALPGQRADGGSASRPVFRLGFLVGSWGKVEKLTITDPGAGMRCGLLACGPGADQG